MDHFYRSWISDETAKENKDTQIVASEIAPCPPVEKRKRTDSTLGVGEVLKKKEETWTMVYRRYRKKRRQRVTQMWVIPENAKKSPVNEGRKTTAPNGSSYYAGGEEDLCRRHYLDRETTNSTKQKQR